MPKNVHKNANAPLCRFCFWNLSRRFLVSPSIPLSLSLSLSPCPPLSSPQPPPPPAVSPIWLPNRQSASGGGPLFRLDGAPSLYRQYNRDRRRRLAAARLNERREAGGLGGDGAPAETETTANSAHSSGCDSSSSPQAGTPPSTDSLLTRGRSPRADGIDDRDAVVAAEDLEGGLVEARHAAAAEAAASTKTNGDGGDCSSGRPRAKRVDGRVAGVPAVLAERKSQSEQEKGGSADMEQKHTGKYDGEVCEAAQGGGGAGCKPVDAVHQTAAVVGDEALRTDPEEGKEERTRNSAHDAAEARAVSTVDRCDGDGSECGGGLKSSTAKPPVVKQTSSSASGKREHDCQPGETLASSQQQQQRTDTDPEHENVRGEENGKRESVDALQTAAAARHEASRDPAAAAAAATDGGAAKVIGPQLPPLGGDAEMDRPVGPQTKTTMERASTARETRRTREKRAATVMPTAGVVHPADTNTVPAAAQSKALKMSGGKTPTCAGGGILAKEAARAGGRVFGDEEVYDDEDDDDFDSEDEERLEQALRESRVAEARRKEMAATTVAAGSASSLVGRGGQTPMAEDGARENEPEEEDDDDEDDEDELGDYDETMETFLDVYKVKLMFDDGYDETCPHYLSNLNWFVWAGGIEKFGTRLTSRPPPKATIVRGLVEILCTIAEVVSNNLVGKILKATLDNLEVYLAGVSRDDLKRSPENRAALFGAMDHIRCGYGSNGSTDCSSSDHEHILNV